MSRDRARTQGDLAAAIGARVTIRLNNSGGGFRDIVGVLQNFSNGHGELVTTQGISRTFTENEIAIWREIKPLPDRAGSGAPFSKRIKELEELSDTTWPASEIIEYGNWRLRISDGFTMRANSVLPIGSAPYGDPGTDIETAIEDISRIYLERGLTPTFTIPLPIYEELDQLLDRQGWRVKVGAEFFVNEIPSDLVIATSEFQILTLEQPTQTWLEIQSDFKIEKILRGYPAKYLEIKSGEKTVGIGRIATKGSWSLATRVYVDPDFRGQGIGKLIMEALMAAAQTQGATKIGLQVDIENGAALSLYKSMGFRYHHSYTYRVLNEMNQR